MEKHQEELQREFQKMGENLDRQQIRPLQKEAYLCMAKCFDDPKTSREAVQACAQRCEHRLQAVNHVVQQEINGFQERMQRCALGCQDEARDMIPPGATEGDSSVQKAMTHQVKCFGSCVKKHIALLPGIQARIKGAATGTS